MKKVNFLLLLFFSVACVKKEVSERPNVVIIYLDDLGYADIKPFGAEGISTPHLNALATEGLVLTDFNVASSVCSPSRAALLLGSYPNRVGIPRVLAPYGEEWSMGVWRDGLNLEEETLAELLKDEGYQTAIIGKWHLGHFKEHLPNQHGFDYFFGIPYSNDMLATRNDFYPELPLIENDQIIESNPDQANFTKGFTEKSLEFIRKNSKSNFFLYLAHPMPHVPLAVSKDFEGKSSKGLYGDVVQELDWSVGQIVRALKDEGIYDNTILIFTSDNGPWLIYGEHAGSAYPLREGKMTTFEGGHRVSFILSYPNKISGQKQLDGLVSNMDLLPTIMDWVGGKAPRLPIDGVSQKAYFEGEMKETARDNMLYYYNGELFGVRKGNWKYLKEHRFSSPGETKGKNGERGNAVTVLLEESLFKLDSDMGESENLAASEIGKVEELKNLMNSLHEQIEKGKRPPGKYLGEIPEKRSLW